MDAHKKSITKSGSFSTTMTDRTKIKHCFFASLFLFSIFCSTSVKSANLRPRSIQKKSASTTDPHHRDVQKQQHSPPIDWVAMNMELTPPSSSYYADEGLYMDVSDERFRSQIQDDDQQDHENVDEFGESRGNRDRFNSRQSTFLISLIVVVSIVAGCGATIVVLGYYCQLCC